MKIAFVLPGRGSSGGVRCTSIVATSLRDRGHEVRILYQESNLTFRGWLRSIRDKLFYPDAPDWLEQFEGGILVFDNITTCHFDPDEMIVAVGMAMSAQLAFLNSLPNQKVQYIHGATPWDPVLMKRALSLPMPKIVVANYLTEIVARHHGGEVLAVVHNGVDRDEYFSSVAESQRDGVGVIYSSHPAKDPATILSVIGELSRRRPNVPIRVFSTDRRPKQISPKMYWRFPSLEGAREIYSRSLVWILASMSEGFPAPVLEAMACGCAVVATDCGGTRDMIVDGENGFLVEVGDVKEIVKRVELLLDDTRLRSEIRSKAQETVRQFGWEKCVCEVEGALERVSSARNRQPVEC